MTEHDVLAGLAQRVHAACLEAGLSLSTAESCTGGLIGHVLTEIPGSSGYYVGGVISYSDELKRSVLRVSEATLGAHGAVSAQTAVAMSDGAREAFGTDLAMAVTGIAGPAGGSSHKPVGLTYVAVTDPDGHAVRRFLWSGDRAENKRASAQAALELLLERLVGIR
ncbi:MAG: CinA family protein [Chloroflexota bacterium]|nr:CinA family protein [Chloroflexota bacterium]